MSNSDAEQKKNLSSAETSSETSAETPLDTPEDAPEIVAENGAENLAESKHRLFVGLAIPHPLTTDLKETLKRLKISADQRRMEVKWTPHENLHITMKFLGSSRSQHILLAERALLSAASLVSPFDLALSGLGAFPDERHGRVIWAGVGRKATIVRLFTRIEEEFCKIGFAPENRGFAPHLTLGRLRKARSLTDLISPFVRRKFGRFEVSEVVLYESVLQGANPIYKPLVRAPLCGPSLEESEDPS